MGDKKSVFVSIEDEIKRAAKEAEDFADKVTADEQPVEVVDDEHSSAATKTSK